MKAKEFNIWLKAKSVYQIVQGVIPNFIDEDSSSYKLTVDSELSPRTDGKNIWVSLIPECLEDKFDVTDWVIFLRAITAHECQHINSSRFEDIKILTDWYGPYLAQASGLSEGVGKRISQQVLNIVEDGRIESIAAKRRPGMLKSFKYLNQVMLEGAQIQEVAKDPGKELSDFFNNVLSYAKTGNCVPGIEAYSGTDFEKNFQAIRQFIDGGVDAPTSETCRIQVEQLLKTCTPYLAELLKQNQESEESKPQPNPEYTGNTEKEKNDSSPSPLRNNGQSSSQNNDAGNSSGKSSEQSSEQAGQQNGSGSDPQQEENEKSSDQNKSDGQAANEDASSAENGSGMGSESDTQNQHSNPSNAQPDSGSSNDQSSADSANEGKNSDSNASAENKGKNNEMLTEHDLEELRKFAEKLMENAERSASSTQPQDDNLSQKDISCICQAYGKDASSFSEDTLSFPLVQLPTALKVEAAELKRTLIRILKNKRKEYKGLRRGVLDTSALWKTGVLENDVFKKNRRQTAGECAFYLLIDNSGSMSESSGQTRKYINARRAAAVIEEALHGLVPCKIALFNTKSSLTKHTVIKPFDVNSGKGNYSFSSLGYTPSGCNSDSIHIRVAMEELLRRKEQKKVLIVLSDGLPSAYASRADAIKEVQKAVNDAKRKGIVVISVMFGSSDFLTKNHQDFSDMYGREIVACQPESINKRLSDLFKQVLSLS